MSFRQVVGDSLASWEEVDEALCSYEAQHGIKFIKRDVKYRWKLHPGMPTYRKYVCGQRDCSAHIVFGLKHTHDPVVVTLSHEDCAHTHPTRAQSSQLVLLQSTVGILSEKIRILELHTQDLASAYAQVAASVDFERTNKSTQVQLSSLCSSSTQTDELTRVQLSAISMPSSLTDTSTQVQLAALSTSSTQTDEHVSSSGSTRSKRATREKSDLDIQVDIFSILRGPTSQVLASIRGSDVTRQDLLCLLPGQWLTASVIDMWLALTHDRVSTTVDKGKFAILHPTWLFQMLQYERVCPDLDALKRTGKRVLPADYIIVPANVSQDHWFLIVCEAKLSQVFVYDSRLDDASFATGDKLCTILAHMQSLQDANFKAHYPTIRWRVKRSHAKTPRQCNVVDCGVYVCWIAENIMKGLPFGDLKDRYMPGKRGQMLSSFICGLDK